MQLYIAQIVWSLVWLHYERKNWKFVRITFTLLFMVCVCVRVCVGKGDETECVY